MSEGNGNGETNEATAVPVTEGAPAEKDDHGDEGAPTAADDVKGTPAPEAANGVDETHEAAVKADAADAADGQKNGDGGEELQTVAAENPDDAKVPDTNGESSMAPQGNILEEAKESLEAQAEASKMAEPQTAAKEEAKTKPAPRESRRGTKGRPPPDETVADDIDDLPEYLRPSQEGKKKVEPIKIEPTFEGYRLTDYCGFREMDIQEIAESFRLSDIMGDGIVTDAEIPRILGRLGESPGEQDLARIIDEVDPDAEGLFDFQKFMKLMTFFDRHVITEEEITEAFKVFDRDGGGSIESAELRHVLSSMGDKMTAEEADGMIMEADKDGDGSVDYAEFVKTILGSL